MGEFLRQKLGQEEFLPKPILEVQSTHCELFLIYQKQEFKFQNQLLMMSIKKLPHRFMNMLILLLKVERTYHHHPDFGMR